MAKGEIVTSGKVAIRSGTPGLASTQIQPISDNCYAGLSRGLASYESKTMMATFNKNGDTLCVFSQQDTLDTPITSTVIKSIPTFTSCMYKGNYTFRRAFNDTIFRLVPPNRIVPVYVLKQGNKKITDEDWYHFKDIVGKLRPGVFFETQNYILFRFRKYLAEGKRTPDGFYVDYQSLSFYFDKKKEKLSLVNITHRTNNSPYLNGEGKYGIENDLDGGLGFWPHYITHKGNLAKVIRPESLKALVDDKRFQSRSGNKEGLKKLAQSLTNNNNETVVMIIE